MNPFLTEALTCYNAYISAKYDMRSSLRKILVHSGFDRWRDGIELTLDITTHIEGDDIENPRVFLSTVGHSPTVSIQIEQEHATPEEIRRLVPYLRSFPDYCGRGVPNDSGFDDDNLITARDVAMPYDGLVKTPIVLFVDSFVVGRLPFDLTYEEAVRRALSVGDAL